MDVGTKLGGNTELMAALSQWLGRTLAASHASLRSIRLGGRLHLPLVFQPLAPLAPQMAQLEARARACCAAHAAHAAHSQRCSRGTDHCCPPTRSLPALPPVQQVYLGRGGEGWQPAVAARALSRLPALARLEFRFSFDYEDPPQDLLGELLLRPLRGVPGAAPPLRQLSHLALVFPPRSVSPPTAHLPDSLSELTQAGGGGGACGAGACTALRARRAPPSTNSRLPTARPSAFAADCPQAQAHPCAECALMAGGTDWAAIFAVGPSVARCNRV